MLINHYPTRGSIHWAIPYMKRFGHVRSHESRQYHLLLRKASSSAVAQLHYAPFHQKPRSIFDCCFIVAMDLSIETTSPDMQNIAVFQCSRHYHMESSLEQVMG